MDNEIILAENEFERVDFDNPMSILSYGSKIIEQMGSFMKNVSIITNVTPVDSLELEERLEKINSFSNYLSEKKEDKKMKPNAGLIAKIGGRIYDAASTVKDKLFGKEGYEESFADQYSKLNEEIDAIKETIENKKEAVLENMKIDRAYVENMNTFSSKLNRLIEIGLDDLSAYKQKINDMKKQCEENSDIDLEYEIKNAQTKINLFEQRIESLKKNLVISKNSILESKQKENTNIQLVLQYQEYNESTIDILRNQSVSMITTKLQRDNLIEQQKLNDMTNNAIRKNSETIVKNIEKSNDLRVQGNINMDTLKELSDNVKKGIELIKKGNELVEKNRISNAPILENMISSFDSYNAEISTLLSEETMKEDIINNQKTKK